jgi:hypothetical protein
MRNIRCILLVVPAFLSLSSCVMTNSIRTIQIEILKPGIFVFPESIDTVSILKVDFLKSDTCTFAYASYYDRIWKDSTVSYRDLANRSVDALAGHLKKEGYFRKVFNFRDSLEARWNNDQNKINKDELLQTTHSDLAVFLNYLHFDHTYISTSHDQMNTQALLSWTVTLKTDISSYIYNQVDTLFFDCPELSIDNPQINGPKIMMLNASEYMGKSFGQKLIPSWVPVERMYYRSKNADMLNAENFALQNEWLKAAELWNRETKNKNPGIVAKACYNMALAAEMEGKYDAAIDWLIKSYSALPKNNVEHKANCQQYISMLALRKKEIERLNKQIRNPEKM